MNSECLGSSARFPPDGSLAFVPLPVSPLPQSQGNQSASLGQGVGEAPFPKLVSKLQLFRVFKSSHHFILNLHFPSDRIWFLRAQFWRPIKISVFLLTGHRGEPDLLSSFLNVFKSFYFLITVDIHIILVSGIRPSD